MANYPKQKVEVDVSGTILEPPAGANLHPDCYLFLGDPKKYTFSPFERFWMPVSAGVVFGIGSLIANIGVKLPIRAGAYRHLFSVLGGVVLGEGCWKLKQNMDAEKDIQYFHYMVLHPEDFKAEDRKKWSEVIRPWFPFR